METLFFPKPRLNLATTLLKSHGKQGQHPQGAHHRFFHTTKKTKNKNIFSLKGGRVLSLAIHIFLFLESPLPVKAASWPYLVLQVSSNTTGELLAFGEPAKNNI